MQIVSTERIYKTHQRSLSFNVVWERRLSPFNPLFVGAMAYKPIKSKKDIVVAIMQPHNILMAIDC